MAPVYDLLVQTVAEGTAVLLSEQNVTLAFETTNRACLLRQDRLVLSGPGHKPGDNWPVGARYLRGPSRRDRRVT